MDEFNLTQAKLGFDDRARVKTFLSKGGGAIYKRIGFSQLGRGEDRGMLSRTSLF